MTAQSAAQANAIDTAVDSLSSLENLASLAVCLTGYILRDAEGDLTSAAYTLHPRHAQANEEARVEEALLQEALAAASHHSRHEHHVMIRHMSTSLVKHVVSPAMLNGYVGRLLEMVSPFVAHATKEGASLGGGGKAGQTARAMKEARSKTKEDTTAMAAALAEVRWSIPVMWIRTNHALMPIHHDTPQYTTIHHCTPLYALSVGEEEYASHHDASLV
jgi:hypothetical protein